MQIDLHKNSNNSVDIGVQEYFNAPISKNIDSIYTFTMIVLFLTALVIAGRITHRWQMGEEDNVVGSILKWLGGIILIFALLTFLKSFIHGQDFDSNSVPNF